MTPNSSAAGGAGVLAGGVVACGVGGIVHSMVDGIGARISASTALSRAWATVSGDSAVKTGQDFAKPGSGIAHTAGHVWDSIF
jgi:hypothetical protein